MQEIIDKIKQKIRDLEKQFLRKPNSVALLAVSKKQSIARIEAAFEAGQCAFGENYLQEALLKIETLKNKSIEWHFIGPIQSNKTRKIAEHFAWVQSVSDKNIAQRLNDQRPLNLPRLKICIQVNVSHEATKSGVSAEEVFPLADYCSKLPNIQLRGIMAIPAQAHSFDEQKQFFHQLYTIFVNLRKIYSDMDTLSMGMSNDMEAAIAEGSTMVRIGSAIFGQRQ